MKAISKPVTVGKLRPLLSRKEENLFSRFPLSFRFIFWHKSEVKRLSKWVRVSRSAKTLFFFFLIFFDRLHGRLKSHQGKWVTKIKRILNSGWKIRKKKIRGWVSLNTIEKALQPTRFLGTFLRSFFTTLPTYDFTQRFVDTPFLFFFYRIQSVNLVTRTRKRTENRKNAKEKTLPNCKFLF